MLSIDGVIEVGCSLDRAWDLFCRFGDVARLIPSVEQIEVDGDRVFGRVGVKLGVLWVTSRVALEVTERKPFACLKAEGLSYLGETIHDQVAKKGVRGIDRDGVGRLKLHLDLRPTEAADRIELIYNAEIEAEGRLKRIYQSILKTKAPAMMEAFAENVRSALEEDLVVSEPESTDASDVTDAEEGALMAAAEGRLPWWRRLWAWLRGLHWPKRSTR